MKRRAFLEKIGGHYLDDFVYISWYPLYDRGFEIQPFDGDDMESTLIRCNPTQEDIIIGSVESTITFFKHIGVTVPKYLGYPEELKPYLLRSVKKLKFGEIDDLYPFFVKPADDVKGFTGALIDSVSSEKLLTDYNNVNDDTMVWVSEPIEFVSEYRCFVHEGKLQGIKHYLGDFKIFPDTSKIEEMIKVYISANVAYTLDVGITDKGETALVEVNDMWAIGSYGMDAKTYVRMCINRIREIIKQGRTE